MDGDCLTSRIMTHSDARPSLIALPDKSKSQTDLSPLPG